MSTVTTPPKAGQIVTEQQKGTALEKSTRVVEGEIVSADAYNQQVQTWQKQGFNVLTPAVALSTIPRDHKIVVNRVQINPNPPAGEVYQNPLFCKDGEVALGKTALEKIAQCAGISIDESTRTDSHTVEHVWSYRVRGHWIGFDGTRIDRIANKTLDLRDGSPDVKGFTANQIVQARRHGEAICESKAINRLFRMYGLKQKYTQRELAESPFIVLKLQWEPDMRNPVVAAIVTQMRAGATSLMYPQGMPGAVDPAGLPAHQVPPEMRPAGIPKNVDEDPPVHDTLEDFSPTAEKKTAVPTPYTVTGVKKQGDKCLVSFKETGDDKLFILDSALARVAFDARAAGVKVLPTWNDAGDTVTALKEDEGHY